MTVKVGQEQPRVAGNPTHLLQKKFFRRVFACPMRTLRIRTNENRELTGLPACQDYLEMNVNNGVYMYGDFSVTQNMSQPSERK